MLNELTFGSLANYQVIHGLLDRVMQVLNVANDKDFYYIKATEGW